MDLQDHPFQPSPAPVAWLVVDPQTQRSVFLDEVKALQYAADHRGVVIPLVTQSSAR